MVEKESRGRRIGGRVARVVLGLLCGTAIAECGFNVRDHGAFPHLNVYATDGRLAVRLRPGARQKVAFGGNAPTSVAIGAAGLRGELPEKNDGAEVLVVGDSQVF